jgi:hypothetical protein
MERVINFHRLNQWLDYILITEELSYLNKQESQVNIVIFTLGAFIEPMCVVIFALKMIYKPT